MKKLDYFNCLRPFEFQEVSQLASSLYTTGTNLSRSVSSAGEHQSETYVSPILPKRAETFGGFDTSNQQGGPLKLLGKKSSGTPAGTPDIENIKPGDSRIFVRYFSNSSVLVFYKEYLFFLCRRDYLTEIVVFQFQMGIWNSRLSYHLIFLLCYL